MQMPRDVLISPRGDSCLRVSQSRKARFAAAVCGGGRGSESAYTRLAQKRKAANVADDYATELHEARFARPCPSTVRQPRDCDDGDEE